MLGFLRLNYTIKKSFKVSGSEIKNNNETESVSGAELVNNIKSDTDKDGLSDYDELNVYHTSVYLADTDSDGYSDKEEVDSGNNPNCPAGQDCSLPEGDLTAPKTGQTNLSETAASDNLSLEDIQNLEEAEKLFSGEATVQEIRQILIAAGMSAEELGQIPDEEIMKMYLETIE